MNTYLRAVEREDRLLTVLELAAKLRVRKQWVYQQVHSQQLGIPIVRVGHFLRFYESDVDEWLRKQTEK